MGAIKTEDVAAYWVDEEIVCFQCYDKNVDEFTNLLLQSEVEDDDWIYTCDRCQAEIKG